MGWILVVCHDHCQRAVLITAVRDVPGSEIVTFLKAEATLGKTEGSKVRQAESWESLGFRAKVAK